MNHLSEIVRCLADVGKDLFSETEAKHQKPKPLLRTYITSLLSLVLCAAMFLGTTYAWFSGNVTNYGNEIYIGTLDVELYKLVDEEFVSLSDGNYTFFDSQIVWEPGHTAVETIRIDNEGQLTFKYLFGFTNGALAEDSTLLLPEVAQCFDVWVFHHTDESTPAATDYDAISAQDSGWVNVGTLDQLLAGRAAIEGRMHAANAVQQPAGSATYTIALHMLDDADASVMGQRISLNVKVLAFQEAADTDGFGPGEDTPATGDDVTEDDDLVIQDDDPADAADSNE